MDIDKISAAIEAGAGQQLDGLKDSLREVKKDGAGRTYTPVQLSVADVLIESINNQDGKPCSS